MGKLRFALMILILVAVAFHFALDELGICTSEGAHQDNEFILPCLELLSFGGILLFVLIYTHTRLSSITLRPLFPPPNLRAQA